MVVVHVATVARDSSWARTGKIGKGVHDLFETCVLICAAFMKAIFFWFFFYYVCLMNII